MTSWKPSHRNYGETGDVNSFRDDLTMIIMIIRTGNFDDHYYHGNIISWGLIIIIITSDNYDIPSKFPDLMIMRYPMKNHKSGSPLNVIKTYYGLTLCDGNGLDPGIGFNFPA